MAMILDIDAASALLLPEPPATAGEAAPPLPDELLFLCPDLDEPGFRPSAR